ncbi:type II toxin-antitoxin system RelE/ParE family toxin [Lentisphaera marina]|uniref:type II toxin-antitoxin system RelE/ParE family toxin n=1 Tax=Lentisphaera marina TaxID=1111041 RepID=UPI0023657CFD|nr:type II toxin-antitoxin system RelE/ParE family toxin [Lentisphaera marina]MDD7983861.1 type II toxin-antitoxin system RelE/ParE family toxin [Lentisphaera marina]
MILSFGCKKTEKLFNDESVKEFRPFEDKARIKLEILDNAAVYDDLRFPPSNKLHALTGKDKEYDAIWINKQWRIKFIWTDSGPKKVQITDYH